MNGISFMAEVEKVCHLTSGFRSELRITVGNGWHCLIVNSSIIAGRTMEPPLTLASPGLVSEHLSRL